MANEVTYGLPVRLEPDAIDGHKSFYGKAYVRHTSALTQECESAIVRELYSYGTKVAAIYLDPDNGPIIIVGYPELFSATTRRHFRTFTRQNADGIDYGIAAIRKTWENNADALGVGLIDARTWNDDYAADRGYRF